MKRTTTLLAAGLVLMALSAVQAGGVPPADGKALSEIVKAVEALKLGVITEVEFDDGFWEVELHSDSNETTLYLDPKAGTVSRQRDLTDIHEELPPKDAKPLSEIVVSVETMKLGTITQIEFEDGYWEVTTLKDGVKNKMDIDPKSGKHVTAASSSN